VREGAPLEVADARQTITPHRALITAFRRRSQPGCQERAQAAAREKQAEQLLESCHRRPCRHSNLGMTEFHAGKAADDEVKLDSQSI
jgi:hypothetical protein